MQRELTWLYYAHIKLSPEEFRPDGASTTAAPKIQVFEVNNGYDVSVDWGGTEVKYTIPAEKALEILMQESSYWIDEAFQATYLGKPYIRRPLLKELKKTGQCAGVLVIPLAKRTIRCEPIINFPWRSEQEFACANSIDVEDARKINKMIIEGKASAMLFPFGSIVSN